MNASATVAITSGRRDAAIALAMRRQRVVGALGALMVLTYFAFMGLFAFAKPLLGAVLAPGLTLCLVLGPALILSGILVSLAYVLWANFVFDPAVARSRAQGVHPFAGAADAE